LWVAIIAAHSVVGGGRDTAVIGLNLRIVRTLQQRIFRAGTVMDWAAFQRERGSDVVAVITTTINRIGQDSMALVQMAALLLMVLVQAGVAFAVAPLAAAVALGAGLLLFLVQMPRLRRSRQHGRALNTRTRRLYAIVTEHLASMKLTKAHNAEAAALDAFAAELERSRLTSMELQRERVRARIGFRIAAAVVLAGLIWLAVSVFAVAGSTLLVLLAVFARLLPSVGEMANLTRQVAGLLPAWAEVETMRHRFEAAAGPAAPPGVVAPQGSPCFTDVAFTWPGRNLPALQGVSLTIARNRTTALIGPSGAGKSTLADLALGLLTPSAGAITIDGVPLDETMRVAWRDHAAYVPQEAFLFHDSVRANLAWTCPHADEPALWQALESAAAADMVRRLPDGLDTQLGDRGVQLSGGERQRLALARALLRQPSFLVLDEATSHLDRGHERLIQDALDQLHGRLTILVIAHRLATVRNADHIAVLDHGRIIETGRWDELAARPGGWLAGSVEVAEL